MPTINFVLGLCTSKNISNSKNVVPEIGRLIQKFHRQDAYCVNAPPRTGPTPPATAHIACRRPR
jgi:hypothetical protein